MTPYPDWLGWVAWFSLGISFLCALVILVHEATKPQKMFIMDLVWPITALYWSVVALWAYCKVGQKMTRSRGSNGTAVDLKKPPDPRSQLR